MNKQEFKLLEKAFDAEVAAFLSKSGIHLMQTKSKIADKLVENGLLRKSSIKVRGCWPCVVEGYELTEEGRMVYCVSC